MSSRIANPPDAIVKAAVEACRDDTTRAEIVRSAGRHLVQAYVTNEVLAATLKELREAKESDLAATLEQFGFKPKATGVTWCDITAEELKKAYGTTPSKKNFYTNDTHRGHIIERDVGFCVYCGEDVLTSGVHLDHLIPETLFPDTPPPMPKPLHGSDTDKKNGTPVVPTTFKHSPENVVTSCSSCNQAKGNRLPCDRKEIPEKTRRELIECARMKMSAWKEAMVANEVKKAVWRRRTATLGHPPEPSSSAPHSRKILCRDQPPTNKEPTPPSKLKRAQCYWKHVADGAGKEQPTVIDGLRKLAADYYPERGSPPDGENQQQPWS